MMTNKQYADMLVKQGAFGEFMRKHFETTTLGAVELSCGMLEIDKKTVQRHFCAGWGYGVSMADAHDIAHQPTKSYEDFLAANVSRSGLNDALIKLAAAGENVYLDKRYGDDCDAVYWMACRVGENVKTSAVKATAEDIEKIKMSLEMSLNNLKKRCATYWKKYGASKLRCWTYDAEY